MKYMLVKDSLDSGIQISVQRATQLLGVSRCGFYKWLKQPEEEQVNSRNDMDVIYLAVILDLFSRRCIGWSLDRSLSTELTLDALRMAIKMRWNENLQGLIHHSDQGVQYASKEYIRCLNADGIQISMSARGNPYDNAFVESFIRTLKYEEVYLNEYETFSDALENIAHFIEDIYNRKRLHSSLGYHSPIDFEKEVTLNSVA